MMLQWLTLFFLFFLQLVSLHLDSNRLSGFLPAAWSNLTQAGPHCFMHALTDADTCC